MSGITPGMGPWRFAARWFGVLLISMLAMSAVYMSIDEGSSKEIFTSFVLLCFFAGVASSLFASVRLLRHKRRLVRIPAEFRGKRLGDVVAELQHDPSPIVQVICGLYRQHVRNPASVDAKTLIGLLDSRLYCDGPRATRRTADLLLALGMLGTGFGLLMTMQGFSAVAALAGNDPGQIGPLLFNETGPLSDLGGSYLSTIAALACGSVVLRGLANVQEDAVDDLIGEFTEMISVYVKPSFRSHRVAKPSPRSRPVERQP